MVRVNFRESTVLTIAHRLKTITDSDRIIVMDADLRMSCLPGGGRVQIPVGQTSEEQTGWVVIEDKQARSCKPSGR